MLQTCPLSNHWNKLWILRSLNLSSQVRLASTHGGRATLRKASSVLPRGWFGSWCPVLCSNQRSDAAGGKWPALTLSGERSFFEAALVTFRPDTTAGSSAACRACAPYLHTGLAQMELAEAAAAHGDFTALWQQCWLRQGSLLWLQQGTLRLWQRSLPCPAAGMLAESTAELSNTCNP